MCGILAFASNNVENFNADKFNILGIMNETRGKHSCGVTVDGSITKGINEFKVWRDFTAFSTELNPQQHPIVIGHTRHATGGAHNMANAHPFGFKNNPDDENYAFIGVHNGSLYNHLTLAQTYGIDRRATERKEVEKKGKTKTTVSYRDKIDSEILLETVFKTGEYKVLEDYNGAAALVWYKTDEPNILYCYHGASLAKENSTEVVEERPLFYARINGGLYISSIAESLLVAGAHIDDVNSFEHNKVFKITDGDIEGAEVTEIDRSKAVKGKIIRSNSYSTDKKDQSYYNSCDFGADNGEQLSLPMSRPSNTSSDSNLPVNIYVETPTLDVNDYKAKLYFNRLRYWRNGHLVTGIYAYIRGYGYYYMGIKPESAKVAYLKIINKVFLDSIGEFSLTIEPGAEDNVPFRHARVDNISTFPFEYIYQGIALKTELDYCQLTAMSDNIIHNTEQLSHASKHPIVNINAYRGAKDQKIMYNGKQYSGRFTVLGAERLYTIKDGNLISFMGTNKNFNVMSGKDVVDIKKVHKELVNIVVDDLKTEKQEDEVSKSEDAKSDNMLLTDVNKMILNFYSSLPDIITHVKSFKSTEARSIVLDALTSIEAELDAVASIESISINN